MITTTAFVKLGGATHFAAADKHDLVGQTTSLAVLDKCGHGMVKAVTDSLHAIPHVQVVLVGMHVPHTGVARVDGDIATTCLAQPASLQEQLADRTGLGVVVALRAASHRVPFFATDVTARVIER